MKLILTRSLTVLALTWGAALNAQVDPQQPPGKTTPRPEEKGQYPATGRADTFLASWVAVENDNEIALAQYAIGKAQNPEVKQFAQTMLDDHKKFADKLQQSGALRGEAGIGMDRGAQPRPTDPTRDKDMKTDPTRDKDAQPTDASGQRPGTGLDRAAVGAQLNHLALVRELGAKCLENAKRELDQKTGAEFDRCYVGMQIAAHAAVLTMLEVFPNHASDSLRKTFEEGKATVKSHLQHAKDLARKLEAGGATGLGDPASPDRKK